MAVPRYVQAVCRARDLLAELQIREPSEILIERIAPFKKAPVRYAELVGCDGRMVRTGDHALITVRASIDRVGQRRFIIAHELGHVLLHPGIRQIDQVDIRQTRNFNHYQEPEELEANYFAAELLMPNRRSGFLPTAINPERKRNYDQTILRFVRTTRRRGHPRC